MMQVTIFNISCNNLYIMQMNLRKNIYIFIYIYKLNRFAVQLKVSQYCKPTHLNKYVSSVAGRFFII